MRIGLTLAFIVAALTSVVSSAFGQKYAPILQEDTIAVIRANVDHYDAERVADQIQQIVNDSAVYFGIESEPKDVASELTNKIVSELGAFVLEPLQESGVKTFYCVINASKADLDSFYNYLAIPVSDMTDADVEAVKDALDLTSFEYSGFLVAPIIPGCKTEEDVKSFKEKHFSERTALSNTAFESGFAKVDADDAILAGVGLPLGEGFWKEEEIVEVAQSWIDETQRLFDGYDVKTPIDSFLDSLLACRRESVANLSYCAWSVNLDKPQALFALESNNAESAERYQRLVEGETLRNGKALFDALLTNAVEGERYVAEPEALDAFVKISKKTIGDALDVFVKFDRDESSLIWKLDAEFFFKNRKVLQGAVAKLNEAGRKAFAPTKKANDLKRLALACHNYHDSNQRFPAAYAEDGKTWLEAETLKPFLGGEAGRPGYAMLVDESGIFEPTPGKRTSMASVIDGLSNTIMLVELADPEDTRGVITFEEFYQQIQNAPGKRGGYHVSFGDGSVRFVPKTTPLETLRALTTRNGGEAVGNGSLTEESKPARYASNIQKRRLFFLASACHMYCASNKTFPPAYPEEGVTWLEAGTLEKFLKEETKPDGCAMIIAEDGIFPPGVGETSSMESVTDGLDNTIIMVELADPTDKRGVTTVEEFYEQLQNCPADRNGYYAAMGSGRVMLIEKGTTLSQLKKLVSKAGDDFSIDAVDVAPIPKPTAGRDEAQTKLRALAIACMNYHDVNNELPPAFDTDGKSWWEAGTLAQYLVSNFPNVHVSGCAALVDESGIFVPTPGKASTYQQVTDGTMNTIMFVELADPKATPGCVTLDEFYEQLQNCPADRDGYKAVMADGGVVDLPKSISLEDLKAGVSKAGGDGMRNELR